MDAELERVSVLIAEAVFPEDLFGAENIVLPPDILLGFLRERYDLICATTDPKGYQHPDDIEAAIEASSKLSALYAQAEKRVRKQLYGIEGWGRPWPRSASTSFEVGPNRYFIGDKVAHSEHGILFQGYLEHDQLSIGEVMIKVADSASDNHFLENDARILDVLHAQGVPQWKHLPYVIERFRTGDRVGLILRKQSGFTLAEVRQHALYRNGVDRRDMIWMLDRILSCLGYVHQMGVLNCNINPQHIRIQARDHNVIVSGWSAAVHKPAVTFERFTGIADAFTAPEVLDGGQIGPWSDIYSTGLLMIWLLGGNTETLAMPASVEPELQSFLRSMVEQDPYRRPSDAWTLYNQETVIKDRLWERKYRPFDMS